MILKYSFPTIKGKIDCQIPFWAKPEINFLMRLSENINTIIGSN